MISIDITDTQIKLIEAALVGGKVSVKKAAKRDLSPGCIENGSIIDMHLVAGEITDILVTEKISNRETIICVNSGMILYREIEIPKPKAGTETLVIETMVQNEMQLGNEYNVTYSISGEVATEEGPKLKVVAAACPQRIIDIYLELARQVGLKAKLVVVSNTCITRLVRSSDTYKKISPFLLLQIDRNFININLYDRGRVVFSRQTKIEASDYEAGSDYINLAIFDNLFRTMHLLEQHELSGQIKDCYYFGDVKNPEALAATMKQLDLKARELEFPADLVRSKRNFEFLEYANVLGSLLKVDVKTENINLLDTRSKRIKSSNMRFGLVALTAAGVCLAAVLVTWLIITLIVNGKENTLAQKTREFELLRYDEMNSYVNEIRTAINNMDRYSNAVDNAASLFDFQPKMSRQIAEKLTEEFLDGMEIIGSFNVSGYNLSVMFFTPDDTHPAAYTEALIESGYFEDIKIYGYSAREHDGRDGFSFQIAMRIKGGNIFES
jgi:type IV pilus assembly protein PilM